MNGKDQEACLLVDVSGEGTVRVSTVTSAYLGSIDMSCATELEDHDIPGLASAINAIMEDIYAQLYDAYDELSQVVRLI